MNIILGGGITGLTAGIKTGYPVYEETEEAGGLCRSYNKNGYRFEKGGGHWIFGDGKEMDFLRIYSKFNKYERDAGVYYNQKFNSPIQDNFAIIDIPKKGTLKDWLLNNFSNEMCRLFFNPFNNKYTCGLYQDIVQDDANKSPTDGRIYNGEFYYPQAGTTSLIENIADECDIHYNKKAISLNLKKKHVIFSDGTVIKYNKLISTIPLKNLLTLAGIEATDLIKTSIHLTNIGAERGHKCPHNHWLYIPDETVPFFRVGFYSNVNKDFAFIRDGVSVYVESAFILTPPKVENIINTLRDWNYIREVDVIDEHIIPTAYTWMTPNHKREEYLSMLKENGIISTGRYGKWKFQGMLDCVKDGLNID
jgi:protoporphyrinogen oxidase